MPVDNILIRLIIGCVQPFTTPGICSLAFSSLMMSSFLIPLRHSSFGFNRIMVSTMLIGELSVAVFARPALPKTFFTSGMLLMILSWTCKSCFASELDISGIVTGINNMVPSSKGGINSLPRLINKGILISNAIILMVSVVLRQVTHQFNIGLYIFSNPRVKGLWSSVLNFPV